MRFSRDMEEKLEQIIKELLNEHEAVNFYVGRNGDFDRYASSAVNRIKKYNGERCFLVLVLPYLTADYLRNQENFHLFYDDIELCQESEKTHPKGAIRIRNKCMVERSDMIICYIDHEYGGAYEAVKYALRKNKKVINLKAIDTGYNF